MNNGQGFVADCMDCHLPAPQYTLDFFYQKTFHYDELWHHEGRRARFGAAMMAPDYTWWHGFYECKKRYNGFMEGADDLIDHNKKAYKADLFPKATGNTERPKEIFK